MSELNEVISKENLDALMELGLDGVLKNSLEQRIVIVGDGNYDSEDFSDFINTSEYVVRTDYGKNIFIAKIGTSLL